MQSLSAMGNPLEHIAKTVDFEIFRPTLEAALFTQERKSNAGRPPIDPVLMFKVMFVQRLYGLSDEQTEYQIKDRTSFREFLGIFTVDDVPDARTIWKYREDLTNKGTYDKLFRDFDSHLANPGLIVNEGKIIDAGLYMALENWSEANSDLTKALETEKYKDDAGTLTLRAICAMRLNRRQQAIDDFQRAYKLTDDPELEQQIEAYYELL